MERVKENKHNRIEELEKQLKTVEELLKEKDRLLKLQREEFESLNAEVQTTNEELKATNEELLALNEELQKNEAALSKSEANTKALINNTLQFFYLLDRDHKIVTFNQIVREHFLRHMNVEIKVGDDFLDYIDESEHGKFFEEFERAFSGEEISGERRVKVLRGPYIWLKYNYTPIHGFGGKVEQVSISTLDITEEVEAKNELIENQLLISSIFKTADVGLCLIDQNGNNVKVNPEYCNIYGLEENDLVGKHFSVVYPNVMIDVVDADFKDFIYSNRDNEYVERTFTRHDGLKRSIAISSQKMTTPDGRRFSVVTVRDMTDILKTKQLLEETQAAFKSGGWEYDLRTGKTTCTAQVYKIFEVDQNYEFSFRTLEEFLPSEKIPELNEGLKKTIIDFTTYELESPLKTALNKKKWIKATCRSVVINNRTVKLFGTIQDITEAKKAEKRIKENQQKFENLFKYASDAIFLIDPKRQTILDCNQVASNYLDYTKEEIIGKKMSKFAREKEITRELIRRAIKKGKLIFENEHVTKGGKVIPVEISTRMIEIDGELMLQSFVRDITKRKQAEQEIRKSEERFRKIFNESPIGMAVVSLDGYYLTVNDELCSILGYSQTELLKKSFKEITYTDDLEKDEELSQQVFEGKMPFLQLEKRYIHKTGKPVWTRVTATLLKDDAGMPVYGLSMVEDISKRKEAELKLKETQQRFQKVFDQSPIGIVLVDQEGYYLDVNEKMVSITGYSREELLNMNFDSITHPDDLDADRDNTAKVFAGEIPNFTMEKRYFRKDGTLIWAKISGTVIRNENSEAIYGLGMIEDITKTKEAEELLRQSEERFEKIASVSPVGIFTTDESGNQLYTNDRYLKLSGLKPEEARGLNWLNAVHPDDRDKLVKEWRNSDKERRSFKLEYRFQKKRKITWVLAQSTPEYTSEGKIKGYIGTITDITERKHAEAQLKKSNQELKKTNSELDRFVYSASHDLRAPLVSILGLINIATHEETDPQKLEVLNMMKKSVQKLDDFIQDIIYYSRNARLEVKKEKINGLELVQDCLDSYRFIEGAEDVKRIIEIDENFELQSDPGRLKIILNNLISNAIRFRRNIPDAFVKISMESTKKNNLVIRVEDNGIGISEKHIDKVFNMFYRAKEDKVGSGLGLYIVKETVEKLKGKIEIKSKVDKGTKFKITIPF